MSLNLANKLDEWFEVVSVYNESATERKISLWVKGKPKWWPRWFWRYVLREVLTVAIAPESWSGK